MGGNLNTNLKKIEKKTIKKNHYFLKKNEKKRESKGQALLGLES